MKDSLAIAGNNLTIFYFLLTISANFSQITAGVVDAPVTVSEIGNDYHDYSDYHAVIKLSSYRLTIFRIFGKAGKAGTGTGR